MENPQTLKGDIDSVRKAKEILNKIDKFDSQEISNYLKESGITESEFDEQLNNELNNCIESETKINKEKNIIVDKGEIQKEEIKAELDEQLYNELNDFYLCLITKFFYFNNSIYSFIKNKKKLLTYFF